jgi:hypothetical protein
MELALTRTGQNNLERIVNRADDAGSLMTLIYFQRRWRHLVDTLYILLSMRILYSDLTPMAG